MQSELCVSTPVGIAKVVGCAGVALPKAIHHGLFSKSQRLVLNLPPDRSVVEIRLQMLTCFRVAAEGWQSLAHGDSSYQIPLLWDAVDVHNRYGFKLAGFAAATAVFSAMASCTQPELALLIANLQVTQLSGSEAIGGHQLEGEAIAATHR